MNRDDDCDCDSLASLQPHNQCKIIKLIDDQMIQARYYIRRISNEYPSSWKRWLHKLKNSRTVKCLGASLLTLLVLTLLGVGIIVGALTCRDSNISASRTY